MVAATAMKIENVEKRMNRCEIPNVENAVMATLQVRISTIGYAGEILAVHVLHCPRRRKKLRTGISSNHLREVLHAGQKEWGETTEIPAGIRYAHTFAKLPKDNPIQPTRRNQ